jgi:tryptophan synthase alpha chain
VTGSRDSLSDAVDGLVSKLKKLTGVPICVGFGISKSEHAATVAAAGADGVIIGSRIVRVIEENLNSKDKAVAQVAEFIRDVKQALP